MSVCPHFRTRSISTERKAVVAGESAIPEVEERDGLWHIRSLALVREVLRSSAQTQQSGFGSEVAKQGLPLKRSPVLFADGPEHRSQRTKIARFFAPAVVNREYRQLVSDRADGFLARFDDGSAHDLSEITLHYSSQVAAQVIGLTASEPKGLARRLAAFFDQPPSTVGARLQGWELVKATPANVRSSVMLGWFYLKDVRPAIRAHRSAIARAELDGSAAPDDVITYLIGEGYTDLEIVMECVTYGAAGMVTTREFLQMAAWHLLEKDELRARFLEGDSAERWEILHEILRLEPVVGHLYRRATEDMRLVDAAGQEHVIPSGARLQLYVRQANTDVSALGETSQLLCPGRELPHGVRAEVMAFGDGPHRCPGNSLAILESEIFLERFLRRPVTVVAEPRIEWEHVVSGYAVRGLVLRAPKEQQEPAGHGHDHDHDHDVANRFDAMAAEWDVDAERVNQSGRVAEAIQAAVPLRAGMRVLDYGAGTGLVTQALLAGTPGLQVVLADVSTGMREQLATKISDGRLPADAVVWDLDLDAAPLARSTHADERFDLVLTSNVLHHVYHMDRVLTDFAALLNDGGHVAVAEIQRPSEADPNQPGAFDGHHGFAREDIAAGVRGAGFQQVSVADAGSLTKEEGTFEVFLTVGRKAADGA